MKPPDVPTMDSEGPSITEILRRHSGSRSCPPPPPAGPSVALVVPEPEKTGEIWKCRDCCAWERVPYAYPPSPWCYCDECKEPMSLREQEITILRLRLDGRLPPLVPVLAGPDTTSTAPTARPVSDQQNEPTEGNPDNELMTVKEAAVLLRSSEKAVYALHRRGSLPGAIKVGARLLIRRQDLLGSAGGRVPSRRSRR